MGTQIVVTSENLSELNSYYEQYLYEGTVKKELNNKSSFKIKDTISLLLQERLINLKENSF